MATSYLATLKFLSQTYTQLRRELRELKANATTDRECMAAVECKHALHAIMRAQRELEALAADYRAYGLDQLDFEQVGAIPEPDDMLEFAALLAARCITEA